MPAVTFKAKVQTVYNMDDTVAWQYVKVPTLTRSHCDMQAFRGHARFGGIANSDLFPGLLRRQCDLMGIKETIRLDHIPHGVQVDTSGFLASVTITMGE